jgi:hypothetical protein
MASTVAISMYPTAVPPGQVTMSGLELVEYINSQRNADEPELRHDNFLAKVPLVLGAVVALNFQGYYKASNGKQNLCYRFPKREACLMAMSYSYELQGRVFDRMTALETQAQTERSSSPKLIGELAIMECYTRLLRPASSSQVAMLTKIAKQNGLDAAFLPSYIVDAPGDASPGSSLSTASLTYLLKANGISANVYAYNMLLRDAGMLEACERQSTSKGAKNGIKRFWCVTERGLGKNLTNPSSPRQTQPHWYVDRFAELHRIASAGLLGGDFAKV